MPQHINGSVRSEGERWDQLIVSTGVVISIHRTRMYSTTGTEPFSRRYVAVKLRWRRERSKRSPINFIRKSRYSMYSTCFRGGLFVNEKRERQKTWHLVSVLPNAHDNQPGKKCKNLEIIFLDSNFSWIWLQEACTFDQSARKHACLVPKCVRGPARHSIGRWMV